MPRPRKSRLLPSITTYTEELVRAIAGEVRKVLAATTDTLHDELRQLRRDLGRIQRRAERVTNQPGRGGRPKSHKRCTVRGCSQPHVARGLCKNHYQQARYGEKKRELGISVRRRSPGPTPMPSGDTSPSSVRTAVAPKRKRKAPRSTRASRATAENGAGTTAKSVPAKD